MIAAGGGVIGVVVVAFVSGKGVAAYAFAAASRILC
jgi:hypothetical protein